MTRFESVMFKWIIDYVNLSKQSLTIIKSLQSFSMKPRTSLSKFFVGSDGTSSSCPRANEQTVPADRDGFSITASNSFLEYTIRWCFYLSFFPSTFPCDSSDELNAGFVNAAEIWTSHPAHPERIPRNCAKMQSLRVSLLDCFSAKLLVVIGWVIRCDHVIGVKWWQYRISHQSL